MTILQAKELKRKDEINNKTLTSLLFQSSIHSNHEISPGALSGLLLLEKILRGKGNYRLDSDREQYIINNLRTPSVA